LYNGQDADSHFDMTIGDATDNYYLLAGFTLGTSLGTARKYIEVAAARATPGDTPIHEPR
jgi:hypothetical protein